MDLGLSTSWNALRRRSAPRLIFEIKSLGFSGIELSFNLTGAMVRGIEKLVSGRKIKVLSVHNFCPMPSGIKRRFALPDFYSLSSPDTSQRCRAVAQTRQTIDTARRLGARAVVLHCGRVEVRDYTRELIALLLSRGRNSPHFKSLAKTASSQRRQEAKRFLSPVLKSLEELEAYAQKSNVDLGIETRFYYREIPSFGEIGEILKVFKGARIFYWHDTGHAQLMENLGFLRHKDYLEAYGNRLLGVHIHDIFRCCDHLAPLEGEIDFSILKPYLKKDTIKIIEAHQQASAGQIKKARNFLQELWA